MSAPLTDHIDRLSQLATSIQSLAHTIPDQHEDTSCTLPPIGPFSRAMLKTPLGDLIRDIDPTELGLFTLIQPGFVRDHVEDESMGLPRGEIARVEFTGATPLKRPPTLRPGRDDPQRPREHDPEVYAQAALKYLDRYQSIRPMPRAIEQAEKIIEQLAIMRESIHSLNEQLKQTQAAGPANPPLSPKSLAKQEEYQIQELQEEIAELRERKEILQKKKTQTGIRSANKLTPKPKFKAPQTPTDAHEHSFWNTPAASARTLRFTDDLLTDEQFDPGNLTDPLFASPLSEVKPPPKLLKAGRNVDPVRQLKFATTKPSEPLSNNRGSMSFAFQEPNLPLEEVVDPEVEANDEEDETIILRKASDTPPCEAIVAPSQATAGSLESNIGSSEQLKKAKLRITTELEDIIVKIWVSVGEIIMPGHLFDVSGSGGSRPPRAKETIAHLRTLSQQSVSPSSPTGSSLSSLATAPPVSAQTTSQQILIAQLLLALLSNAPSYSMSLNKLKEILSGQGSVRGQAITRPIYGCVAKKLLKIERGGGEQVVKFDI